LHKLGYVHRDIKPTNILLDDDLKVKIIDFGLGNMYEKDSLLRTPCGSPCYAAPELIAGEVYDPIKVDIWSAGIVLYAMVVGCLPFDDDDKGILYNNIMTCNFVLPAYVSLQLKDLISSILCRNPKKRIGIEAIKRHRWFASKDSAKGQSKSRERKKSQDPKEDRRPSRDKSKSKSPGRRVEPDPVMKLSINANVLKYTARMCGVSDITLGQMIEASEQNKHTTSYFLLLKKYNRGELDVEIKELVTIDYHEKKKLRLNHPNFGLELEGTSSSQNIDDGSGQSDLEKVLVKKTDQGHVNEVVDGTKLARQGTASITPKINKFRKWISEPDGQIKYKEINSIIFNNNNLRIRKENRS
jgi:serine/threonine protein kinase